MGERTEEHFCWEMANPHGFCNVGVGGSVGFAPDALSHPMAKKS